MKEKRIPDVLSYQHQTVSKPTPTPARELHPIRDLVDKVVCGERGCGEKKSN